MRFLIIAALATTAALAIMLLAGDQISQKINPQATPVVKQDPSKTEARLAKMQDYQGQIEEYEAFNKDSNVARLSKTTKDLLTKGISQAQECIKATTEDCQHNTKDSYLKAITAFRLLKYYAILAQKPNECVEADLGMSPTLKAKGITKIQEKDKQSLPSASAERKNNPKETGQSKISRLFLCSTSQGDLAWRIIYPDNKLYKITPEYTQKLNLTEDPSNLANKTQVAEAEKLIVSTINIATSDDIKPDDEVFVDEVTVNQ